MLFWNEGSKNKLIWKFVLKGILLEIYNNWVFKVLLNLIFIMIVVIC